MTFYMTWSCFSFTDIEIDSANFLAKKGIIVDNSANPLGYNLDSNVLRQEIAGLTLEVSKYARPENCKWKFKDVNTRIPNSWACYSIEWLLNNKIISENEYFRPEENISKSEALWMIVKAVYGDEYSYNEELEKSWQEQVVEYAVSKWLSDSFADYDEFATRWFVFDISKRGIIIKEEKEKFNILSECLLYWECSNKKEEVEYDALLVKIENNKNNILEIPSENNLIIDFDIRNVSDKKIYIKWIKPEITNNLGFTENEVTNIKLHKDGELITTNTDFDFKDINVELDSNTIANFSITLDVASNAVAWKYFTLSITDENIDISSESWKEVKFLENSVISSDFIFFANSSELDEKDIITNRDLSNINQTNDPIIEFEEFVPTADDLYRFFIAAEKDIEIKSITMDISWDASFAWARFIITKNKKDGPIVAVAEVSKDFDNGPVVFTKYDEELAKNQVSSNFDSKEAKIYAFSKTRYFIQLDYIPSDVLLDNKGKSRTLHITGIEYTDLTEE